MECIQVLSILTMWKSTINMICDNRVKFTKYNTPLFVNYDSWKEEDYAVQKACLAVFSGFMRCYFRDWEGFCEYPKGSSTSDYSRV